jgi:hypothetical protein
MEQVKVESEQWTEMQDMLEQVRQEMLELQLSRDLWQRRAIASDISVCSLHAQVCTEPPIGSLGRTSLFPVDSLISLTSSSSSSSFLLYFKNKKGNYR